MTDPKDYTERGWIACAMLVVVLTAVSFIPPAEVCGLSLRRANILSEVLSFDDAAAARSDASEQDVELAEVDWESVSRAVAEQRDTVRPVAVQRSFVWYAAGEPQPAAAPEAGAETGAETGTEAGAEAEYRANTEANAEVVANVKPEAEAEVGTETEVGTNAEASVAAGTVTGAGAGIGTGAEMGDVTEADGTIQWPRGKVPVVAIEDADTTGQSPMKNFYRKLAQSEPVRIAFLGDSFVEGDILTADLREALQLRFGGMGAGFSPFSSPLTGFRRTVKTQSKGWTAYNVMQQAKAPADVRSLFTVSGWVCRPSNGASTRWEMVDTRQCLKPAQCARIWFRSGENSQVEVVVNDSLRRNFKIEGDDALREIAVHHHDLRSLELRVVSGAGGFFGYGASFSAEKGITVDNYSIRSNNGQALFRTSPALNAQLQNFAQYDLVVLQYGLNIMQQGVHVYAKYSEQLKRMIAYVRECFPGAAVLVLGVSERCVKGDAGFQLMDAIPSMIRYQRRAAIETGAAFWSTADAMRALGGMEHFVAQGWAGKDYTHINYAGGRQIARALYDALYYKTVDEAEEIVRERVRREEQVPVLDPVQVDSLLMNRSVELIP